MRRDEITEKAQAIAQALDPDNWVLAKPRLLLHRQGYGIEIHTSSNVKQKDRLILKGYYLDTGGDDLTSYVSEHTRSSLPSITVSLHREPEAIANEIRTRFLPAYREALDRMYRSKKAYQERLWLEKQLGKNLRNALGARDATQEGGKISRIFPRRPDRRQIEVDARVEVWHRDAPEMVRITIAGLSPEEATELLTWTQKINPPLEETPPSEEI